MSSPPSGRDRKLQPGELEKPLNALSKEMSRMVHFALETAMRRGGLAGMIWEMGDLKKRTITLPDTKNGEKRIVPFSSEASVILKERLRARFEKGERSGGNALLLCFGFFEPPRAGFEVPLPIFPSSKHPQGNNDSYGILGNLPGVHFPASEPTAFRFGRPGFTTASKLRMILLTAWSVSISYPRSARAPRLPPISFSFRQKLGE